jgi:hypothetical protein
MARMKGQIKCPSEPLGRVSRYDRCLLYGATQISDYMGCNPSTLRSWIRNHAFPAAKMPNGAIVSSTELIDRWILSRNPYLAQFSAQ